MWSERLMKVIHKSYLIIIVFNVTADVYIPANEKSNIFEGNTLAEKSNGAKYLNSSEDHVHFLVESGKYEFVILQ